MLSTSGEGEHVNTSQHCAHLGVRANWTCFFGNSPVLSRISMRKDGYGSRIDKHYMVMRLDNAPTEGYEHWVGERTTHRLVQVCPVQFGLSMFSLP